MPRTTTTTTRRRTRAVPRGTKSAPTLSPPIYIWGMRSSKPRAGGAFITYEVRLNDDGSTSCNCPGWMFKKKDQDRGCKHTRHVDVEAKDFFKRFKRGETLPQAEMPESYVPPELGVQTAPTNKSNTIKFNRVIEFD